MSLSTADTGYLLRQGENSVKSIVRAKNVEYWKQPGYVPFQLTCPRPDVHVPRIESIRSSWRDFFDMSSKLRTFLYETYATNGNRTYSRLNKDFSIQIDDQDDNDHLPGFCTLWVNVLPKHFLQIELCGAFPITKDLADLVDIYHGFANPDEGRLVLKIKPSQIEALLDLAAGIRATATTGQAVNNPHWRKISARTISSLYRFVRVVKEYQQSLRRMIAA
jgi:hypothetical protein